MQQDSIQKATSVDITPQRKGSFLRPVTVRGDSFRSELDGSGKAGKPPRPISTGSLRPISTGTSTVHWPSSPAARSSYQPEWVQDTENVLLPAATVDDHGSPEDLKDMLRMGRTQEMRRVFRQFSLISFGCLSQCTWEFVLLNNNQALQAGGPALLFWSYIWSFAGSLLVTASLAEMCSMVPSSGGQYVWVSEFAGKRCQSFLSYIAGYMTLIGWQCGNASGIFLTGSLIQCIITIYRPENGAIMWQTVVFLLPCVAFVILVNIYGGRAMAISQNISMSVHILALIAVVVIMWVLSPHIPTDRALFRIENTEWSSTALAMLAGQANMNYSCSCKFNKRWREIMTDFEQIPTRRCIL
ncbi:amino acid transporter [Aureobasidium pullulans]|nr:amino acid transporter [Aureobasidium pullulans]